MLNDFRRIIPGGQLSAAELNRLQEAVMALSELQVAPPLQLNSGHLGQGYALSIDQVWPFLAKITGQSGTAYAWSEVFEQTGGTFSTDPAGRSGTTTHNPAYELSANANVPIDGSAIVLLWPMFGYDNSTALGTEMLFAYGPTSTLKLTKFLAISYLSATINSNQNDYNFSSTGKLYANVTGAANITGLQAGVDGQILIIWNGGNANLSFTNQDAASAAANRIITPSGNTYVLYPNNGVILEYNGTKSRWVFDSPDVFLPSGATATTGLVPQPSLSAGTTKFLREDATWQTPAGAADNNNDWNYFRQVGTSPLECWYPAGVASSDTSITVIALASGSLLAYPFVAPRGGTLDRIGAYVSVGGAAGAKIRLGIYNATSATNLYPNTLVVDSGDQVATASATAIKVTINQTLTAGNLYWFVILGNDSTIQMNAYPDGATFPILGSDSTLNVALNNQLQKAQAYGALPATFPAAGTPNNDNIFLISVRYSA